MEFRSPTICAIEETEHSHLSQIQNIRVCVCVGERERERERFVGTVGKTSISHDLPHLYEDVSLVGQ